MTSNQGGYLYFSIQNTNRLTPQNVERTVSILVSGTMPIFKVLLSTRNLGLPRERWGGQGPTNEGSPHNLLKVVFLIQYSNFQT